MRGCTGLIPKAIVWISDSPERCSDIASTIKVYSRQLVRFVMEELVEGAGTSSVILSTPSL